MIVMPTYQELIDQIQAVENGDDILTGLTEVMRNGSAVLALKIWLDTELNRLSSRDKIKTPSEQAILDMLDSSPGEELGLQEICERADIYQLKSLKKLGYASRVVNTLASKGIVGKWRIYGGRGRPKTKFGKPERAVVKVLTQMDVTPSEVDDEAVLELSDITGMPVAKIVDLIGH